MVMSKAEAKSIRSSLRNSPPLSLKNPFDGCPGPVPPPNIHFDSMALIIVSGFLSFIILPLISLLNSS